MPASPVLPVLLLLVLSLAGCGGQPKTESPASSPAVSAEAEAPAGTVAVAGTGLDTVYIAPGVDLSRYASFYIEPVEIQYDPSPRQDSLQRGVEAFRLDERDLGILQRRYQQALAEALEARVGWTQVGKPGPGVVALRSELRDYYLYASLRNDLPQSTRTLVGESSRFRLMVQAVDAGTGELLLQSSDRRVTGDRSSSPDNLRPFSAVRYWSDFSQDIRRWARQLSDAMLTAPAQAAAGR